MFPPFLCKKASSASVCRQDTVPALSVFVSVDVLKTALCETVDLHFPPPSGLPRSTAYEPTPWTAEQTPDQPTQMEKSADFLKSLSSHAHFQCNSFQYVSLELDIFNTVRNDQIYCTF